MKAFDIIYKKYSRRLFGFVFRYVKQETDTEEIVQEVFIKIWQSRENINIYSSFESFLFTIAHNATVNLLKKGQPNKNTLNMSNRFNTLTRPMSLLMKFIIKS